MVQLFWPKMGYTIEKTMFFSLWVPIFSDRGGDLFLTHRGGAFPPPPLPMCVCGGSQNRQNVSSGRGGGLVDFSGPWGGREWLVPKTTARGGEMGGGGGKPSAAKSCLG